MLNETEPVLCFWCDENFRFKAKEKISREKAERERDQHEKVCRVGAGILDLVTCRGFAVSKQVAR